MPFHGSDGDSSDGSMHSARKADGEAIVDIESVVPVGTPMAATSIAQFIRCNSHLETMEAKRDVNGWVKWLLIAVFAYLIFAPILAVIPTMKEPAVVGVLWAIIVLLCVSKIEYSHRSELWFICICRGVIVDMPKTDRAPKWLCSPPVLLALVFFLVYFIVVYVGVDPQFKFEDMDTVDSGLAVGVLALLGILFVFLLAKATVDVEGATGTLSLNLVLTYFGDHTLLAHRGFTVVHFSQIVAFVHARKQSTKEAIKNKAEWASGKDLDGDGHIGKPPATKGKLVSWLDGGKFREARFSWDEVHALGRDYTQGEPTKLPIIDKFSGGVTAVRYLKTFKNLDA